MIKRAQDVFLLFVRCYFGYQFFQSGFGKAQNIDKPIAYFASLSIPFSEITAYCVAGCELVGGILLFFGLLTRPAASILSLIMLNAYFFADKDALFSVFSDPDAFMSASPFGFLFASLTVWMFGPGKFSMDGLFQYLRQRP